MYFGIRIINGNIESFIVSQMSQQTISSETLQFMFIVNLSMSWLTHQLFERQT